MKRVFFILPVAALAIRVRRANDSDTSSDTDSHDTDSDSDSSSKCHSSSSQSCDSDSTDSDSVHSTDFHTSQKETFSLTYEEEGDALFFDNFHHGHYHEAEQDNIHLTVDELLLGEEVLVGDLIQGGSDGLASHLFANVSGGLASNYLKFDNDDFHLKTGDNDETKSLFTTSGNSHLELEAEDLGVVHQPDHPLVSEFYEELHPVIERAEDYALGSYDRSVGQYGDNLLLDNWKQFDAIWDAEDQLYKNWGTAWELEDVPEDFYGGCEWSLWGCWFY